MPTEPRTLGLATLRIEGAETYFDPGRPETPEQKAARKRFEAQRFEVMKAFAEAMMSIPETLTPEWLSQHYSTAARYGDREDVTYLRRLTLWRIASGFIKNPQKCAQIVMPDAEEPYSKGW